MTSFKGLLSVSLFAFLAVGCANDSKSSDPYAGLDLYATPANPAPRSYLKDIVVALEKSQEYIPSEDAIFATVIDGQDIKHLSSRSQEKQEALQKLNSTGQGFLQSVQAQCTIQNASKREQGGAQEGQTQFVDLKMATVGDNCPLLINRSTSLRTYYKKARVVGNRSYQMNIENKQTMINSVAVKEPAMQQQSGLISFTTKIEMDANINATGSADSSSMSSNVNVSGEIRIELHNGDVISGPLLGKVIATDKSTNTRLIFNGQSSQGAIRIAVSVGQDAKPEVYINGEKFDPEQLGGLINLQ